ncbi:MULTISPECIES: MlaC/ttg2D family ABC transporter substrate-binding protein [Kordiimonas]|jgi:phospholipid transport system substrate-binding protein|uniref:Phospholipid transport system substrate-binding protein n=1 Tax=Kordiimonas lacus TaxID=637679 RepID=A0A1G6VVF9_9PROT|nr:MULTISPECIES: ABC transporter substrate-binding protein [Kordiimonas]SDD57538.1 phospholipid transport system substrate-binding protein [Kordiimonas lacus]
MKRLLATLSLLLMIVVPAKAQGDQAVDDARGAIDFIQRISDETIAVWSDSKMTEVERYNAFRAIFEEATDIELLARGMLGRHYRTATSEQRDAYMKAMGDYIVSEFDKRMAQIGFKTLAVTGTKAAPGKHGHLFVSTEVERDEGEPILADWRVRKKDGKFQIVNLEFEGINLMITNRDVFSSKVKDDGMDGLISWLKAQNTAPQAVQGASSE